MTAPATLVSLIKTQKRQSEISSTNLAHADQEGYVRKEVDIISLGANQYGFGGVTLSQVYNTVDPALQAQTRLNNAILSKSQVIDKVYQDLNVMFGSKGGKTTFSHELGRLAASFTGIMAKPDLPAKTECINHAVAFSKSISSMAEKVNNSRTQVDQETGKIVDKINELVKQIADANKTISKFYTDTKPSTPLVPGYMDITTFETDRAQLVHELAGLIEINVSTTSDNKLNISMTEGGGMLVQGAYSYQLDYMTATAVKPGDILSPVSYLGTDITAKIKNGQLGGMLQLRDKDLVRAQAEFDELTRVVRDTVNALHNQGASLKGSSSLTGTISAPGLAGLPMTGTTHISGTGTLRLAVIDTMGTIIDYKDVSLTDGMTIDTLMATVNGASYTIGGGATPAAGGGILLEQLPSGALKLSSTSGHTIALGSVSGMPAPQISGGVTYDAATGLGFSHFFGLNNFFDTGNQLVSTTAQVGIANELKVRDDLVTNGNYLSVGTLNTQTPIPTNPGSALGNRKTDIADALHTHLTTTKLSFASAGDLPALQIDAQNYSGQLLSVLQGKITQASHTLKANKTVYDQIATLAAEKSAVDVSEEFLKIYQIKTSQQLASRALKLTLEMQQYIVDII